MSTAAVPSAFLRRLLLWAALSLSTSTAFTALYWASINLSLAAGCKALVSCVFAYAVIVALAATAHCRQYGNAGGNGFDRFRLITILERAGLSLLIALVAALTLPFAGPSLTTLLLPILAVAPVAYDALFPSVHLCIETVPEPLSAQLTHSAQRCMVKGFRALFRCVVACVGSKVAVDVACSVAQVARYAAPIKGVSGVALVLREAFAVDCLVRAAHLCLTTAVCLHFISSTLAYSLTHPVDVAKVSSAPSDEALLRALAAGAAAPVGAKRDYREWLQVFDRSYERLAKQYPLRDDLPVVGELSGDGTADFFKQLISAHAQCDLNRIVRHQPARRRALFDERVWTSLLETELELLVAVTLQVQLVMAFLKRPAGIPQKPDAKAAPAATESAVVKRAALILSTDIYAPATAAPTPAAGAPAASARPAPTKPWKLAAKELMSDAALSALGLPVGGELAGDDTVIPSAAAQDLLRQVFLPMLSQRLVLAVENVSLLLQAALVEDASGVTVSGVPVALYALLRLDAALGSFTQVLHQCHAARVTTNGKTQFIRYKVRSAHYLPGEVVAVQQAVQEGIAALFRGYHDILADSMFPEELRPAFQQSRAQVVG